MLLMMMWMIMDLSQEWSEKFCSKREKIRQEMTARIMIMIMVVISMHKRNKEANQVTKYKKKLKFKYL